VSSLEVRPTHRTTTPSGLVTRALEVSGRLANDAAEVITATAGRGAGAATKTSPFDWVTDTDRTLERHTRRVLAAEFPDIPVLGEEFGGQGQTVLPWQPGGPELLWVVDPVDGTSNYVAGLPWCGYSLGLLDADGPLVGVIADPYQAQIYAAARGRGVRANGRAVVARPNGPGGRTSGGLAGGLVLTEPPLVECPPLLRLVDACRTRHAGVRILGSSALAITQVALGRAVAAVLFRYALWDIAGALALALESGAQVTDLAGIPQPFPLDGLVVATGSATTEVLELLAD
jgi:myo-inositol-1(or 4)-monophosphatase